jgi:hypothetical protein
MLDCFCSIKFILYIIVTLMVSCEKEVTDQTDNNFINTSDTLVQRKSCYYQNDPYKLISYTDYQYNSLGFGIKSTSYYLSNNKEFKANSYDSANYDNTHQLITRYSYCFNNQTLMWSLSGIETHTFPNDSTELISNTIADSKYTNSTNITRKNNLIIKKEYFNESYIAQSIRYDYYSNNQLKKERYYNNSGNLFSTKEYQYHTGETIINTYNKENKLESITSIIYNNNRLKTINVHDFTWSIEQEILRCEYDRYGRLSKEFKNPVQYPYMSMIVFPSIFIYQYTTN